jgi:hypothetical protein
MQASSASSWALAWLSNSTPPSSTDSPKHLPNGSPATFAQWANCLPPPRLKSGVASECSTAVIASAFPRAHSIQMTLAKHVGLRYVDYMYRCISCTHLLHSSMANQRFAISSDVSCVRYLTRTAGSTVFSHSLSLPHPISASTLLWSSHTVQSRLSSLTTSQISCSSGTSTPRKAQ